MRKTQMLPWMEEWVKSYSQEEKILKEICKDELIDIFHISRCKNNKREEHSKHD
ncbi:hypothetical protein ABHN05_07440 [Brevibacillus laterosporus]|uniref:hypothetical protein n=1 Tax=Brevibacillus laterosporus TaxID=1465 RepID=UPI001651A0C5|nr:hypothetical protein [Brevibacillus laterosporus]MED4763739.1 hypothetical protein [Brevibacillus laterosporus]